MKFNFALYIVLATLFIACNKDSNDPDLQTPVLTIEQQLSDKVWLMDKISFTENDKLFHYKRNGSDNNVNYYITDRIIFNEDGTGTYKNFGANTFNISWAFKDIKKTVIEYTIHDFLGGSPSTGKNLKITMENITIKDDLLSYAEIYTKDDNNSIVASVHRIVTKE